MSDRIVTESRLEEALQRLLTGNATKVKQTGRLSLNKINKEAGLGHSYVHKFPEFVGRAKLKIDAFNESLALNLGDSQPFIQESKQSDVDRLRVELKRERGLKDKYRRERDDALEAKKQIEALYQQLMFRAYDLQVEVRMNNVVNLPNK